MKIPVTEQIVKYSDRPVWHQQPCHAQNCSNHLSFTSWNSGWSSGDCVDQDHTTKCIEATAMWLVD